MRRKGFYPLPLTDVFITLVNVVLWSCFFVKRSNISSRIFYDCYRFIRPPVLFTAEVVSAVALSALVVSAFSAF